MDAVVAQLRAAGHDIKDEDVARLSSLKHKNLNVLGRYSFSAWKPVDGLRPLRDPDARPRRRRRRRRVRPGADRISLLP
ncbi:Tn3 family transposase (plasmid) [Streptomyces sp. Qhu-G9]|nr:Tn3 family transposase [Streptomyces aurantiacus]WAU78579.1 Tn3 family transposase [Streptomyces aurantiacus]